MGIMFYLTPSQKHKDSSYNPQSTQYDPYEDIFAHKNTKTPHIILVPPNMTLVRKYLPIIPTPNPHDPKHCI